MSETSLFYKSPVIYEALMWAVYRPGYLDRYRAISKLIPPGSSVVDVCCGPAVLYRRFLKRKNVDYVGLDVNSRFTEALRGAGATGITCDIRSEGRLPVADYVIIQASLYHFLPAGVPSVLNKFLVAAHTKVIVAEPIRNLSQSRWRIVRALARQTTNPGTGEQSHRFDEESLDSAIEPYRDQGLLEHTQLIAGDREKLFVLRSADALAR